MGGSQGFAPTIENFNLFSFCDAPDSGGHPHVGVLTAASAAISAGPFMAFLQRARACVACLCCLHDALVLMHEPPCVQSSSIPSRAQPGRSATMQSEGTPVPYACVSSRVVLVSAVLPVHWAPRVFVEFLKFERVGCHMNVV